jgi:hypothetical protein
MSSKAAEFAEQLRKNFAGPMSDREVEFLRDVQGFVEFAIRNGLSFPMVVSGIMHDFGEIVSAGMDYEKARARGFLPKVTGYSKLTSDDFGQTEEAE